MWFLSTRHSAHESPQWYSFILERCIIRKKATKHIISANCAQLTVYGLRELFRVCTPYKYGVYVCTIIPYKCLLMSVCAVCTCMYIHNVNPKSTYSHNLIEDARISTFGENSYLIFLIDRVAYCSLLIIDISTAESDRNSNTCQLRRKDSFGCAH